MKQTADSADQIPVIDVGRLSQLTVQDLEANDPEIRHLANQFRDALHITGFAYLVNHDIPKDVISTAFAESKSFFELPLEQKMKYLKNKETASTNFHGYVSDGHETLKKDGLTESISVEKKECFDVWLPKYRQFPTDEAPTFQGAMESMENACKDFDKKLLRLLAISLDLPNIDYFANKSTHLENPENATTRSLYRTIYYPPIPFQGNDDIKTSKVVGCNEHTDWDILTLLFQDSVGGLEVKTKDGKWIPASPIPDSIVINTGDLLEAWTGGYFKATPHRVRVLQTNADVEEPKEQVEGEETNKKSLGRQSIAYFLFPDDDVLVSPLQSDLLVKNCSQQYIESEPLSAYDYFVMKATEAYAQY